MQVERPLETLSVNFSNCVPLVVTLTNLLILLPIKKYPQDMVGCIFTKENQNYCCKKLVNTKIRKV